MPCLLETDKMPLLPETRKVPCLASRFGSARGEPELLRACYVNSLALAARHAVGSIAFPAISTGAYGYPIDAAAGIAVATVREVAGWATEAAPLELVRFVCFSAADREVY